MSDYERRWKLVEADDGEFTSSDIFYFWIVLHLFPDSQRGYNSAAVKLQPVMKKIYDRA